MKENANKLILEDGREYIFPLFTIVEENNVVQMETMQFLGTAFFVTKMGDAITAAHVVPEPKNLPKSRRVVAAIQKNGETLICYVNHFATFGQLDLALVKINIEGTKYLTVNAENIFAGEDVAVIGVPSHSTYGGGLEMRLLKGHVTLSGNNIELNFAIPAGMSGSPILKGPHVIGCATGRVRSEEIEESTEEIVELSNSKEVIHLTEVRRVTYYGIGLYFL